MSALATPFVSVAVRSYRRLPQLVELVTLLLSQDYPAFEVVVIEQSEADREAWRVQLEALSHDERLRILEYPPLGAGEARNEAARQSRGDIVLFIDDDDLPVGKDWIRTHAENYADPQCVAVSGRQTIENQDLARHDTPKNRRLCLRYSWLKFPRGRVFHGARIVGVTQVAGGNASIRKSAIERAGGWEPEPDHDEDSFNFRFARVKKPGEYFVYDPRPLIIRRFDIAGGLGRRQQTVMDRLQTELRFSHRIIRRYYPFRFWSLYPLYLLAAGQRAVQHVYQARRMLASRSSSA